jgi:hypothetical protein
LSVYVTNLHSQTKENAKENARRKSIVASRLIEAQRAWKTNCEERREVNRVVSTFRPDEAAIKRMHAAFYSIEAPRGVINERGPPLSGSASKSAHWTRMGESPLLSWLMAFIYPTGSPQLKVILLFGFLLLIFI